MAKRAEAISEPRLPLSRERVLREAVAIADRDGIDALSMRRLAQELGVEAMSLYHYVRSKDELLAAMVDLVYGGIELAPVDAGWKQALRSTAISTHAVLRRHPWATNVPTSPKAMVPSQLRLADALLGALARAGLPADLADHAYHALDSHIVGFTLWLARLPIKKKGDVEALAATFLQRLAANEYPHLAGHVRHHLRPAAQTGQSAFEFGLDLILDGIERMRRGAARPRSGAARRGARSAPRNGTGARVRSRRA